MDLLGRFRKLDKSLNRGLDNGFARVFGGAVIPAEIEEMLKQEAESHLIQDDNGALLAPDSYTISLSHKDFDNLTSTTPELADNLADRLSRFLRNEGWQTRRRARVYLRADDSLHTGQLRGRATMGSDETIATEDATRADDSSRQQQLAEPSSREQQPLQAPHAEPTVTAHPPAQQPPADPHAFTPIDSEALASSHPTGAPTAGTGDLPWDEADTDAPWSRDNLPDDSIIKQLSDPSQASALGTSDASPADAPKQTVVTLLLQDGSSRTHCLPMGETVIGRSSQADFRLPDTGVSRSHAKIMWDGRDAVLVDMDSTNGTFVNDVEIKDWLLDDGDVINMGHSDIEVRFVRPED